MTRVYSERDSNVYKRVEAGERQTGLAGEYGVSASRIRQIYQRVKRGLRLGYGVLAGGIVDGSGGGVGASDLRALLDALEGVRGSLGHVSRLVDSLEGRIRSQLGEVRSGVEVSVLSEELAKSDLSVLRLSPRSWNCLRAQEIETVGQLLKWSRADLLRTPNFGRKSLREVEASLDRFGVSLSACSRWDV